MYITEVAPGTSMSWDEQHWRLRGQDWARSKATDDQLERIAAFPDDPQFWDTANDSEESRLFNALALAIADDTESEWANHADAKELAEILYGDDHFDEWPTDEETRWVIEGITEVWESRLGE